MPFKFWKKEKAEKGAKGEPKGKEEAAKEEAGEQAAGETKEVAPETPPVRRPEPAAAKLALAPAVLSADVQGAAVEVHGRLVELGLTIGATKDIFSKRVALYPGGPDAFMKAFREEPYRAVTHVLVDWLGIRGAADFDPPKLLEEINTRLSSFGIRMELRDLAWLDQELGLRKARLQLGDQEKVVRFKDARDFIRGVNDLVGAKRIAFLELETWSDDFDFLLVRDPRWDKLASTDFVVVKAPQTAVGGECGECGAKVGKYWNDCLACGAVFG